MRSTCPSATCRVRTSTPDGLSGDRGHGAPTDGHDRLMATLVRPAPIQLSIETPADAESAWTALTDPDRVAEWFADVSPIGGPGDPYRIDFGDSSVEGVLVDVEPGRRLAYTWRWEGADDDEQTVVAWTVEPVGD